MAGVTGTGISAGLVAAAVALMGAAPIPPGPQVAAGTVYQVHQKSDLEASTLLYLAGRGTKRVPDALKLDETQRVEVLAASGGIATRVRISYLAVQVEGHGAGQDRKASGHSYVVSRTPLGAPPKIEGEDGKAVEGKLALKIWDDVHDVLAPDAVRAFVAKVLARPAHTFQVPKAIFPALVGSTEDPGKFVSATMALVGIGKGQATLRLVIRVQIPSGPLTLDLKRTRTVVRDAATGRFLHGKDTDIVGGHGTLHSRLGKVQATLTGHADNSVAVTWDPKPAGAKGAGAAGK